MDYVAHLDGDHLDWLRGRASLLLVCGQGQWEDTTGALESHEALRAASRSEGHPLRARPLGPRRPARLAVVARAARAPPAAVLLMATHLVGLLLGTEEDWPGAFEALVASASAPFKYGGETHELTTERVVERAVRPALRAAATRS